MKKLKIVFVSSEVVPFAKTGGLADVAGALPKALSELGHDVMVFMPKYGVISEDKYRLNKVIERIDVQLGDWPMEGSVHEGRFPGTEIPVYFIDNKDFFNRQELYQVHGKDYEDNLERFTFFSRAVLETLKKLDVQPNIIHCNDWQTGLVPAYLKTIYSNDPFFKDIKTVFTIHNIGYQGLFPKEKFHITGLGWDQFHFEKLEFHGKLSLIKGGLVYSDVITTVSKTYSREIQTEEYGYGLEGLLRHRNKDLYGVVNGIDYNVWNPMIDEHIPAKYGTDNLSGKGRCKKTLQRESGLAVKDVPLIGMITRLASQKGLDLVQEIMNDLVSMDVQFIILGTGEPVYHEFFKKTASEYPKKVAVTLGFDNALAHKIEAGSDIFLMPSRYEPCGLNQLYSLKYGTIPLVRKTGGLADTIVNYTPSNLKAGKSNGFVFKEYSSKALLNTIKDVARLYHRNNVWQKLMLNGMSQDFSWHHSALEYERLYPV
ncbi:MAG: glycogen synthase GlgA [Candidatus Omnitrophica bacterium]|nr:glycogen synthase GlgA [Candidatus Omnitrophota bacterium]